MTDEIPVAVVLPTPGGDCAATVAALARQSAPPPTVLVVAPRSVAGPRVSPSPLTFATLGEALRVAVDQGPWVWLLDSGVIPEPSALEELLGARRAMPRDPPPALLASQVLTPEGTLDRASMPALEAARPGRVLGALEHHGVALRAARYGSLLVHAASALQAGLSPRTGAVAHDLAWTTRQLGDRAGMLVPASVVVRRSGRRPVRSLRRPADLFSSARLLAEVAPRERLWFLMRLIGGPPGD